MSNLKFSDISHLVCNFGFEPIKIDDALMINVDSGIIRISIERHNGINEKRICEVDDNLNSLPTTVKWETTYARNIEIKRLYRKGMTQQELSEAFDLSQPMISRIVKTSDNCL